MGVPKKVVYKGEVFFLQTTGRYYQSGRKDQPERILHRRVWADANGPIPEGFDVHHKDGDWTNNDLSNLEVVDAAEHRRSHTQENMPDPAFRKRALEGLEKAREAAGPWHATAEGLAWHKKNGKASWEGRAPVKAACTVCGKTYETYFPSRSRYCSKACAEREAYHTRYKDDVKTCLYCGKEFACNRYRKQTCCSRVCANRLRAASSKGLQPDPRK